MNEDETNPLSSTGLSQEQYDLLMKFFWPEEEQTDEEAEEFFEKIKTPEELHQLAWNYNWDDGIDIPLWISEQKFCDRGTALLLYWRACPRWFCQYANKSEVSEWEVESYDFIKELEERYLSGFYTHQTISFNPTNDLGSNHTTDYMEYEAKQTLPPIMLETSPGRLLEKADF